MSIDYFGSGTGFSAPARRSVGEIILSPDRTNPNYPVFLSRLVPFVFSNQTGVIVSIKQDGDEYLVQTIDASGDPIDASFTVAVYRVY